MASLLGHELLEMSASNPLDLRLLLLIVRHMNHAKPVELGQAYDHRNWNIR
jgi:hypothetical protein